MSRRRGGLDVDAVDVHVLDHLLRSRESRILWCNWWRWLRTHLVVGNVPPFSSHI